MSIKRKLTDEIFALIPSLIEQGQTKAEIAETYGVTVGTLTVQCSRRGVSLRKGGKPRAPHPPVLPVVTEPVPIAAREPDVAEAAQIVSLRLEAKARGMTEIDLVASLIEIIVKDRLYDAVLGTVQEPIDA